MSNVPPSYSILSMLAPTYKVFEFLRALSEIETMLKLFSMCSGYLFSLFELTNETPKLYS
ncbi:Uncharacterised protein [Mycoplasmopsis edwardii]|uniref:Uncharacterized protein n=1 Tax=Mycoplasmopsis edwardii TaxID=53558 RepID=A0A3B0PL89_9BACT|nr:Uncharacterised protein [Mycoplasmopsis edwardii]